jgi:hypothetical protein
MFMHRRVLRGLFWLALSLSIYILFLYIAIISMNTFFCLIVAVLTPLFIGIFYANIRDMCAKKKEILQIESQKTTRMYYDNIWYRPADSTRLEYLANKLQEIKKKIRRK